MDTPAATFHEVYEKHSRAVYRFAFYLTGDRAKAEDLTAEAFLRIWASAPTVRFASVKAYLLAIVRNLHIEEHRRERRFSSLPDELPSRDAIDERAETRQDLQRVTSALQTISEPERAALLLRTQHGLGYGEIARMLGTTVGAARVQVHRARVNLLQARKGEKL